jgi:predicted secreted hydrolase
VDAQGRILRLSAGEVEISPRQGWRSPTTNVTYPVAWRLRVPEVGLEIEIEPYLEEQEVDLSVRYWEGAVFGAGVKGDEKISVEGYLELAGY